MKDVISILRDSELCQNMNEQLIAEFVQQIRFSLKEYVKDEMIFDEWDTPDKLYILANGKVLIAKDSVQGKRMIITEIQKTSDMFAEVYVYMKAPKYDCYALAVEPSVVLEITSGLFQTNEGDITEAQWIVLQNLLTIFAKKAYKLNQKVKVLSSSSLRQKIIRFIIQQKDNSNVVILKMTREEMADSINIARPSLSRELSNLQDEKLITVKGKKIIIHDLEKLEAYI